MRVAVDSGGQYFTSLLYTLADPTGIIQTITLNIPKTNVNLSKQTYNWEPHYL